MPSSLTVKKNDKPSGHTVGAAIGRQKISIFLVKMNRNVFAFR